MEKRKDGAGFRCAVMLALAIVILLGSREAETSTFVPPVAGPIKYSPCPDTGLFEQNNPDTWYSVAWSGQYSEITGSRCEGSGGHPGVDIRDGYGETIGDFGVYAIGAGVVIVKKNLGKGWGQTIVIQHDNVAAYGTIYSVYAHLDSFERKIPKGRAGEITVETGEKIGTMGYSGLGDPAQRHLHFQIEPKWNDLTKQGVERCSQKGKPFWPCYTNNKGDLVAYPSSAKTCGPEIDNCLSNDQRREAAGYVANNTINPMWLVETVGRSSWPMFQHDPQHTGRSADTSISPPLTQRWTYLVDGMITSSPTIAEGVAYFGSSGLVGSSDGKVHAVDANRGTVRWTHNTDPSIWSAASVSGNRIYIAGSSSLGAGTFLYSLNASDGNEIWKVRLGPSGGGTSSPVVFDGVVYVGSGGSPSGSCPAEGHKVYAISAENGDVLWAAPIVDPNECRKDVLSSPAVTQDTVVVGTWGSCFVCPTVFAFDRLTGAFKWSAIVYTPYIFPAPSNAGGIIYVRSGGAGHGGDLIAFEERTGIEVWRSGVGAFYNEGSPAIADGVVYTASGFQIHALDAMTGAPIWTVPAASAGSCASGAFIRYPFFAVANGLVFIKSGNECNVAKVYAVSASDGTLLWDSGDLGDNGAPGGADSSTPAVAYGWLYFGIGNTVYAYGP